MKKLICVMLSVLMTLSLFAGCQDSGKAPAAVESANDAATTYNIAIVQQLDHASLDEIRLAITAQLQARAGEDVKVHIEEYNGQNDASMLNQIGTEIASGDLTSSSPSPPWLPRPWSPLWKIPICPSSMPPAPTPSAPASPV